MNWHQMVVQLRQLGISQAQIARDLECSQGYICAIEHGQKGRDVSYSFGIKLIALHKRHMRNAKRRKKNP